VTGLSSFTVYRSRNGGTPAAMTTPTVTELDATNMPGVYALLLDEDTTLTAGRDTEELALHIAATGMLDVTRTVELYRPETTEGQTLTVSGGTGNAQVKGLDAGVVTAAAIATDAIGSAQIAAGGATKVATSVWSTLTSSITTPTSIGVQLKNNCNATISSRSSHAAADVWSVGTRELTSGANIVLAKGVGITGLNDLDAAGVRAAVGLAAANLDTQLSGIDSAVTGLNDLSTADIDARLAAYDAPTHAELAAAFTEIKGATWSAATDTLEALRDRGDAAWATATGFSTHSAADIWNAAGRSLTDTSGFSLSASGLDLVTPAEPGGVPAWNASLPELLAWIVARLTHEHRQTGAQQTVYNAAGNAVIAAAAVSDDGTTAVRGGFA
jgi:hypothetical protein